MKNNPINIFGLTHIQLQDYFISLGEKAFRGHQVYQWLYKYGAESFEEMTDLSKALRDKLKAAAVIGKPKPLKTAVSQDSVPAVTKKVLFELADSRRIETVYIPDQGRKTVCLSTQVGCNLGCRFCATGTMGLTRDLTPGEIVGQLVYMRRYIDPDITNIVFMGMGEPFQNYDNVMAACEILTHQNGPCIGKKKITISTAGLVPAIRRFTEENQPYSLAVSLNATTDETRRSIMPIAKKFPLKDLLESLRQYNAIGRNRVTLEYVLIDGVNDTDEDVKRLKKIVAFIGRSKVNVIVYNPVDHAAFRPPTDKHVERFMEMLSSINSPLTLRKSRGSDIAAACGQLAVKNPA